MKFLIKKLFLIHIIFSISFLIWTFYRSEIYWDGKIRNYYFTYYIISLILILFSIFIFFLSNKIKEYLILSYISLITSLYAFEAFISFVFISKEKIYEKETGKKFDKRSKFEIYKDLKKINNKIAVKVSPNSHINKYSIQPLSGIANVETIYKNENGYYMIFNSDRYGFNNPDKYWDMKNIEYVMSGDSFAHGCCVNAPNDIASVLRSLSGKLVLNLGYSGNGPLIQYATLREYLKPNTKKVLWFYFEGNDLRDLKIESKSIILNNYLVDSSFTQNLKPKQTEINKLLRKIIKKREKNAALEEEKLKKKVFKEKILRFVKLFNIRQSIFPKQQQPELPIENFKLIMNKTKELVDKNNSELYFIYLPEYSRYTNRKYDNKYYHEIKNIITDLDINFVDIDREVFQKQKEPIKLFPFERVGHYNEKGYKNVGEVIYKFSK